MREGIKMTKKYQIFYTLITQLFASGISVLFTLIAFWTLLDKNIFKEILSIIFVLVNFGMIYSQAGKFAWYDKKPYTPLNVDSKKSILMGLVVSAVTLILFIVLKLSWALGGTQSDAGMYLNNGFAIAGNALFMLWTFPFFGILGMSHGYITWYSLVILLVMPPVAAFLGYNAELKDFHILEKIYKFSFVQKKETKKK